MMALYLTLQLELLNTLDNRIRRRALRNERQLNRMNSTVLELDDVKFRKIFRVNRTLFSMLANELTPHLKVGTTRRAIPPHLKILVILRFLAQGNHQLNVGNDRLLAVAQPTVSVILKEVVDVMNRVLCPKYIKFPSENEIQISSTYFRNNNRMPGIIGVIDCTHIRITTPIIDEFLYVNRKHDHSLNVQLICDHKMIIRNVNAKFPGSTHDSFIWHQSLVRQFISETLAGKDFWLFGDLGYPLEPWLIVPFKDPTDESHNLFNDYHSSCHSIIERCIGVLKARWRCLKDIRGLHYSPEVAGKIINACVALHNLCITHIRDYADIDVPVDDIQATMYPYDYNEPNDLHQAGSHNRDCLIGHLLQSN